MTLTKEQREAIRAVSDLPRAIGCTQCHNYIQKNYSNQFAVLRAMIDSGEHFTDASKLIPSFDLEMARATLNVISLRSCTESKRHLSEAIAEIKVLRPRLAEAKQNLSDSWKFQEEQAAEIERLRASLVEHEEHENQTHVILGAILGTDDTLENVAKRAMARIAELEKWLVEERASRLSPPEYGCIPTEEEYMATDSGNARRTARQQLKDEGKIGPDATKPRSWQITEERKKTLIDSIELIELNNYYNDHTIFDLCDMLRAMREVVEQCE